MPLAGIGDIIASSPAGVGAFNVIQLEHATAIVAGAEALGLPVVLQISENCVRYHGALAPIARASMAVAELAKVPVAVHLDHATRRDLVEEAVELGIGSVMFDASALPDEENVRVTAEVVAYCHERGVWVEAELGEVGGKDGVHAPGARTKPHEAVDYVARTGVDALAVAVGSSHAMTTKDAVLDLGLIAELHAAVPVPLVLHGSSGVPDETLSAAVRQGMKKINIATHLNKAFTGAVRDYLARDEKVVDSRKYLKAGREAVAREVTHLLKVLTTPA
ncbi:ketose-bisphosphate aldolase [Nonomuraea endophytica]|uniref:ketose-bisphosphate aldolase n=1 Tax=Nonomuraea endophytica TaxID=714136 RepID=UPI0037C88CF0